MEWIKKEINGIMFTVNKEYKSENAFYSQGYFRIRKEPGKLPATF